MAQEAAVVAAASLEALGRRLMADLERERRLLGDPFLPQLVLVGSRGIRNWLRAQLAGRGGGCINVRIEYITAGLAGVLGESDGEPLPLLSVDAMALVLLELAGRERKAGRPFRGLWSPENTGAVAPAPAYDDRAVALARRTAEIVDRLLVYRPDQAEGLLAGAADALAEKLGLFQGELVQRLWQECERLHAAGAAHHLFQLYRRWRQGGGALPAGAARHLFGVAALPPLVLRILEPLLEAGRARLYLLAPLGPKAVSPTGDNLALGSEWGRLAQDFLALLKRRLGRLLDCLDAGPEDATSLLEAMQHRLCGRVVGGAPAHDGSVQFHGCHGPTRQVEALKDRLLRLFEDDVSLEPRQVVVMTPQVELYGPLVQAIFSQTTTQDGKGRIPVQVADRAGLAENLYAVVLEKLFRLAQRRVCASELVELLSLEPVHRQFDIASEQLADARKLMVAAGIRWGLDAADRERAGQPRDAINTVRFGAVRMAAGLVADTAWPLRLGPCQPSSEPGAPPSGLVVPLEALSGERAALAARLIRYLRAVEWAVEQLRQARDGGGWCRALRILLSGLCRVDFDDAKQREDWNAVQERLEELERYSAQLGFHGRLEAAGMRAWLGTLAGAIVETGRAGADAVTVCSFKPMRAVPYRVVCLLGMDEGSFPRAGSSPGEEFFEEAEGKNGRAAPPCCSRPDSRAEDLQVLLEAVLSAREKLLVFFTARDPHSNEARHPAGPIESLLEEVARLTGESRDRLVLLHPLLPISRQYFSGEGRLFSYSGWAFRAAGKMPTSEKNGAPERRGLFAGAETLPLPPLRGGRLELDLEKLLSFLRHPARHLLQHRLGVYFPEDELAVPDREPLELGSLDIWNLSQRLMDSLGRAEQPEFIEARLRAEGKLPPGAAGRALLGEVAGAIGQLLSAARTRQERIRPLEISIKLVAAPETGGRPLPVLVTGRVELAGEGCGLEVPLLVHDDPQKPKNRLLLWVKMLAAASQLGLARLEGSITGLENSRCTTHRLIFAQETHEASAAELLSQLVSFYLDGLCRPLPLPLKSGAGSACGDDPRSTYFGWGEQAFPEKDEYWDALFPESAPIFDVGFERLCRALWLPIKTAEKEGGK